jgi:hypothetical protein
LNDNLEQLELDCDDLRHQKEEAKVMIDWYNDKLKNITNPELITANLIRKEVKERELKEVTDELAKKAMQVLEFNN